MGKLRLNQRLNGKWFLGDFREFKMMLPLVFGFFKSSCSGYLSWSFVYEKGEFLAEGKNVTSSLRQRE